VRTCIETVVIVKDREEKELKICYDWDLDTVIVYIDGKEIFSADWTNNLKDVFDAALKLW